MRELREKVSILTEHQLGMPGRVFGTKELVLHKHYVAVYRLKDGRGGVAGGETPAPACLSGWIVDFMYQVPIYASVQ
jgi:hypothetical protein